MHISTGNSIGRKFGKRGVRDLEKISTVLYVTKEARDLGCKVWTRRISELKPYISYDEAKEAVRFVDEMFRETGPVIREVRGTTSVPTG